jgi:hypothetical protein
MIGDAIGELVGGLFDLVFGALPLKVQFVLLGVMAVVIAVIVILVVLFLSPPH